MEFLLTAAFAGLPFPSEDANYFCSRRLEEPWPLPCRPPKSKYALKEPLRSTFSITAWCPPPPHLVETYVSANFNLVFVDAFGPACNVLAGGADLSFNEVLQCIIALMKKAAAKNTEVGFIFSNPLFNISFDSIAFGEPATLGARITNHLLNFSGGAYMGNTYQGWPQPSERGTSGNLGRDWQRHYPSAEEIEYIIEQLDAHNVSSRVAAFFLHDDDAWVDADTATEAKFLASRIPANIAPFVNTFPDTGPATLYESGQYIFAPEEYAIQPSGNATDMALQQLIYYAANARIAERYRLEAWPIPAIYPVSTTSQLRLSFYAALAYGARGVVWNPFMGGMIIPDPNMPWGLGTNWTKREPQFSTITSLNADGIAWGNLLIREGTQFIGALTSGGCTLEHDARCARKLHSVAPSKTQVILNMTSDLTVGVHARRSDDGTMCAGGTTSTRGLFEAWLVIVDMRTSDHTEPAVSNRNATITLHSSVQHVDIIPSSHYDVHVEGNSVVHVTSLSGGGCFLLKIRGNSTLCNVAAETRVWWFNPSSINLHHVFSGGVPGGPKPGLYDIDVQHTNRYPSFGGTLVVILLDSYEYGNFTLIFPLFIGDILFSLFYKGVSYNEGNGVSDPSFIIVGDVTAAGFTSDASAMVWIAAGFTVANLPRTAPHESLASALQHALAHGFFIVVGPDGGANASTSSPTCLVAEDARAFGQNFSCHPSWGGFLVLNPPSEGSESAAATECAIESASALRCMPNGHWMLPLAVTESVETAEALVKGGVPMVLLSRPLSPLSSTTPSSAVEIAQQIIDGHDALRSIANEEDAQVTAGASIDMCRLSSDSLIRFAAYIPLSFGAQALSWRNIPACAPPGGATSWWDLISSINRRVQAWGGSFFTSSLDYSLDDISKRGYSPSGAAWSTATRLLVPGATAPNATSLITAMDDDLLVTEFAVSISEGEARSRGQSAVDWRRYALRVLFIVDLRVSLEAGAAPQRTVHLQLRDDVTATQPLEASPALGFAVCDKIMLGYRAELSMPGGSGQLMAYTTRADVPALRQQRSSQSWRRAGRRSRQRESMQHDELQ